MGMSPRIKAKKGRFGAGGLPPTLLVISPIEGDNVSYNTPVAFSGEAFDDINGDVSAQIVWTNDYNTQTFTADSGQFTFVPVGSPIVPAVVLITATYTDGTTAVTETVTVNVS